MMTMRKLLLAALAAGAAGQATTAAAALTTATLTTAALTTTAANRTKDLVPAVLPALQRAMRARVAGLETQYSMVVFKDVFRLEPAVVSGSLSARCSEFLAAGEYAFKVPFGKEDEFWRYFRAACQGVTLRATVTQTFAAGEREACAAQKNTVRFRPSDKLGVPIEHEPYYVVALDITCIEPPATVYPEGNCQQPARSGLYGGWNVNPLATYYILNPAKYQRTDIIVQYDSCIVSDMASFLGTEDQLFTA